LAFNRSESMAFVNILRCIYSYFKFSFIYAQLLQWWLFMFMWVFILLYSIYMWWRDVVREATLEDQHTFPVQRSLRFGMILFIVSEIMFFFAFFWAFFHSSLSPVFNIGGVWPPESVELFSTSGIPLTNTFFLLSSGVTVTWAHHALINRAKKAIYCSFNLDFSLSDAIHFSTRSRIF